MKSYELGFGVSVERSPGKDEFACDVFEIKNAEVQSNG